MLLWLVCQSNAAREWQARCYRYQTLSHGGLTTPRACSKALLAQDDSRAATRRTYQSLRQRRRITDHDEGGPAEGMDIFVLADQGKFCLAHGFRLVEALSQIGVEGPIELAAVLIGGAPEAGHHGAGPGPFPHVGQAADANVVITGDACGLAGGEHK